ncbi:ABC transporter ATP-binding protein [Phaeodactylibacter xiamenensis]|jgi:putative ABC transport system ATP-binding protein|uniref:Macrolide ABC transporter ATP-binding protein n=1 Tax=Phaeodactylibacter xiamenensis TaxID=1524460 RepID=A0A098SCI9_9BACT|nr:ABC transporter ATP-binding protein [Phaeodactylibacter xiamenensis]KGE88762.1 macrolide ABC transporter ATP-binding protein [Phaeodactylibacter xiamenensis]MCR9051549.1 ABC transporter ATP-binding protein [bacterium]
MIQLENITKVYQTKVIETTALDNINIEVPEGEFLSIMGPSGCGKSTLLNIMGMIDEPTTGQVKVAGKLVGNYHSKATARFRNEQLGFIFQSFHLINELSVIDNVELPLIYRKVSGKQRRQMAEAALTQVGLSNRMKHFPSQLSGGQKQRVAIARAIVGQPRIILADEPTGNLDSAMGNEIMDILMRLNQEQGTTIVMVTHDETMARKTHRLVRLFDGQQVS